MTFDEWWDKAGYDELDKFDGHSYEEMRAAYRAGQEEMREQAEDLMVYPIDREAVHYLPLEGDDE
jgi:hypothetical protein